MSALTLTREERAALAPHIWFLIPSDAFTSGMAFSSRAEALALIEDIQRRVSILDDLGWQEDDDREEYPIHDPSALAWAVRELLDAGCGDSERERSYIPHVEAGDRDYFNHDTQEEALAELRRDIAQADAFAATAGGLLKRAEAFGDPSE